MAKKPKDEGADASEGAVGQSATDAEAVADEQRAAATGPTTPAPPATQAVPAKPAHEKPPKGSPASLGVYRAGFWFLFGLIVGALLIGAAWWVTVNVLDDEADQVASAEDAEDGGSAVETTAAEDETDTVVAEEPPAEQPATTNGGSSAQPPVGSPTPAQPPAATKSWEAVLEHEGTGDWLSPPFELEGGELKVEAEIFWATPSSQAVLNLVEVVPNRGYYLGTLSSSNTHVAYAETHTAGTYRIRVIALVDDEWWSLNVQEYR